MSAVDAVENAAKTIRNAKDAIEYMEKRAWFKDREPDPSSFRIVIEMPQGAYQKGQHQFTDLLNEVCGQYKSQMIADATQLALKKVRESAHVIGEYSKSILDDVEVST